MSARDAAFMLCMCPVPGYHVLEAIDLIGISREGREVVTETIVEFGCYDRELGFRSVRRVIP